MADYTFTKSGPGRAFPDSAVEVTWDKVEPLVTAEQVRTRHLFGIPMVSFLKDPISGKHQVYTDPMITDTIDRAIAIVETEVGIDIFPQANKEKHAFDRYDYQHYGYLRLERRPVSSVEALTITPPNGQDIYKVPLEWIETAYLPRGQINLIPLGNAIAYGTPAEIGSGGALFLSIVENQPWVPAFWQVSYTSGFLDGDIPKIINELIGVVAAMEILSALAPTYARSTSHSLGIDGVSQSVSGPGPQIFKVRFEELQQKRQALVNKIKSQYALKLFSGAI